MKSLTEQIENWANGFFTKENLNVKHSRKMLFDDFRNNNITNLKIRSFSSFLILWAKGKGYQSLIDGRHKELHFINDNRNNLNF